MFHWSDQSPWFLLHPDAPHPPRTWPCLLEKLEKIPHGALAYRNMVNENSPHYPNRGVARGRSWGARDPPLVGLLLSKQPTIFRWRKRHDNILAVKAIVEKPTFYVKYFRQRLLSLVNMGLHAAIIRLSPLIHEREQRYKPYIVWWVASVTPPLKTPGYAPEPRLILSFSGYYHNSKWIRLLSRTH